MSKCFHARWTTYQSPLSSRDDHSSPPPGTYQGSKLAGPSPTRTQLIKQLRPESARELQALLALCKASVDAPPPPINHTSSFVAPNGVAHFVKNRHGPFNALMSILSKVKGKTSPSYWDLFRKLAHLFPGSSS
jgi:hypothetical protein